MNAKLIDAGKEWLCECVWADVEADEIQAMSDAVIIRALARHWDGGLIDFACTVFCN